MLVKYPRAAAAAALVLVLALGTLPAEAQLVRRSHDGRTLLIDPILCYTDYQVRQAIAARGFTNIFLNAPIETHIRARATRGKTVYVIDFNRCTGSFVSVRKLRPAD